MLNNWKTYLFENFQKVKRIEDFGNLYEQFIGEFPELRKHWGVYYTPQYIVDYIVENTIGKLIENKTPDEVSKIKILDPSCGSGSFLLGAYLFLLNYHQNYYIKSLKGKITKDSPLNHDGQLTTAEKKRILLNNIFGVDIDMQAVEVTKLSLLIKAMEGETTTSIETSLQLFHQRILPSLDNNILCGNSLIAPDFEGLGLTPKEERKINVFDWKDSFKDIFKTNGGFDAVIGNPPYVKTHNLNKNTMSYYTSHYTVAKGQFDLFSIFIEKVFTLLKPNGFFSFIVPSLFIKGVQYEKLRELIQHNSSKFSLKEYGDGVFEQVKMPTCIFGLEKGINIEQNEYFKKDNQLFSKIATETLGAIARITRGLEIGKDKLNSKGEIKCLTGGNIDCYQIKSLSYINNAIAKKFSKTNIFVADRILVRETGKMFFATVDYENTLTTRSIYNVIFNSKRIKPEFYLGIINSNLFKYYFSSFISPNTNIFPKIRIVQLKELPLPRIDLKNEIQKELYNNIISYVSKILNLYNELKELKNPQHQDNLKRKIKYAEEEINKFVYQLYDITDEEIITIENHNA